jgi:hypothetical protein
MRLRIWMILHSIAGNRSCRLLIVDGEATFRDSRWKEVKLRGCGYFLTGGCKVCNLLEWGFFLVGVSVVKFDVRGKVQVQRFCLYAFLLFWAILIEFAAIKAVCRFNCFLSFRLSGIG